MQTLVMLGINVSLWLIVFCLGLAATVDDWRYPLRQPGRMARSLFSMNIVMPLVAVFLARSFNLLLPVKVALIAMALAPVPPLLPRKGGNAGGSASYMFGLLVTAVVLSIVFVPGALAVLGKIFGVDVHVPIPDIASVVFGKMLIPLVAGMVVRRVATKFAVRIEKPLAKGATLLLVVSVLPLLLVTWPQMVALMRDGTLVAFILFCATGHVVGHLLGGPESENRVVLALATAGRHPGIALTVAAVGFPQEKAALAAILLILIVNALSAAVYLSWHRHGTHARRHPAAAHH